MEYFPIVSGIERRWLMAKVVVYTRNGCKYYDDGSWVYSGKYYEYHEDSWIDKEGKQVGIAKEYPENGRF